MSGRADMAGDPAAHGTHGRREILRQAATVGAAVVAGTLVRPGATSARTGDPLILGRDNRATGVTRVSGTDTEVLYVTSDDQVAIKANAPAGTAVQAEGAIAVSAFSLRTAISAESRNETAVRALGGNIGVFGYSGLGAGVVAQTDEPLPGGVPGIALLVEGPAFFSRSGILTVRAGASKVSKGNVHLRDDSLVFATLQQSRRGVHIEAAVPYAAGNRFTIILNRAVAQDTHVAWFIIR